MPKLPRSLSLVLGAIVAMTVSVIGAPQLLAFPHRTTVGATHVYSEVPLKEGPLRAVLARADTRLKTSPLYDGPVGKRVFLTSGGWRWRLLALAAGDAVGLTRPWSDIVSDAVILNHSDIARDRVSSRYGSRSISGVIAHERTHIMVRRRLGLIDGGANLPRWISEGYADHVAGESTLSAAEVARLRAAGDDHPAIFYFEARRRIEAVLDANGGNVDALFRGEGD